MLYTERMVVLLRPEEMEAIRALPKIKGVSVGAVVRRAIQGAVRRGRLLV